MWNATGLSTVPGSRRHLWSRRFAHTLLILLATHRLTPRLGAVGATSAAVALYVLHKLNSTSLIPEPDQALRCGFPFADLDVIADYIALDRPKAARRLVQKVISHVQQLADFALYSPRGMLAQSSLLPRPEKEFCLAIDFRIIWQADLGPSEGSRFQPIMFAVKHLFLW